MDDLKSGDILILISDGSRWEFIEYQVGYITRKASDTTFRGSSGVDKSYINVKRANPAKSSQSHARWMFANEFRKEEVN